MVKVEGSNGLPGGPTLPLFVRLAATYALIVAATLIVVAGLTVQITRTYLMRTLDGRLASAVRSFQEGPSRLVGRPEDLAPAARAWLAAHAFSQDEVAAVRTSTGELLTSVGGMNLYEVPGVRDLLLSSESRLVRVPGKDGPVRALAVPLVRDGRQVGTVLVATYETPVERTVREIFLGILWASVVGLAFATALGIAAVRRTIQPLHRMLREVEAIQATGDLSKRVASGGPRDEVGRLAEGFDRMLARLEEAFRSQQRFLSDASHELRTPLAVAKGHLELLEHEIQQAESRRSLAIAGEELERMRRVVEDLLLLARLDEGMRLARQPVEAELIVREALLRAMLLGQRPVSIQVEPGLYALADADRLLQVLTNLLSNAIQYAGRDAGIAIVALRDRHRVIFKVSDTGPGIPPEDLPHVFERFYRGSTARGASPGGTGLGLAIAASLVQAMGGEITVQSAPEVGTTFTVSLRPSEAPSVAPRHLVRAR